MKRYLLLSFLLITFLISKSCYGQYNPLDITFGLNGKLILQIDTGNDVATSIIQQTDGKILVGGYATNFNQTISYCISRLLINGELDSSFGINGIARASILGVYDYISSIDLQADGKILATGYSFNSHDYDISIARFNTNGELDSSFGNSGKVILSFNDSSDDKARCVKLQLDGKILLTGETNNDTSYKDIFIARLLSNGQLDSSFHDNGFQIKQVGNFDDYSNSIAIQTDGKIVIGGFAQIQTQNLSYDFIAIRFNSNGVIDSSFGNSGIVTEDFSQNDNYGIVIDIQTDGKILMGGILSNIGCVEFASTRFNSNGMVDTSYGNNGLMSVHFTCSSLNRPTAAAIQPDDKFVIVGNVDTNSTIDFAAIRLNVDGSLDSTFNLNGKAVSDFNSGLDYVYATFLQSDKKILLAGSSFNGHDNDIAILRYNFETNAGMSSLENVQNINLFPNPVSSILNINFHRNNLTKIRLEIFDVNGSIVIHQNIDDKNKTININSLAKGVYGYRIISNEKILQQGKLVRM